MDGLIQLMMILLPRDYLVTADLTEAYTTIHQNKRYNALTQYQCYDRAGILRTY